MMPRALLTASNSEFPNDLIENVATALKGGGIWAKLDGLWLPGVAATETQAKKNWLGNASYDLTAVNSPTFAPFRGYTGDGVSSHLSTNMVRNALSKYTQDSASIGAWVRNNVANSSMRSIGGSTASVAAIFPRTAADQITVRINDAAFLTIAGITTSAGLTAANRSGAALRQVYKNGASVGNDTTASAALTATTFYLLRDSTLYSTHQIAAAFIGGSLTAGEHALLYSILNTAVTAAGAL